MPRLLNDVPQTRRPPRQAKEGVPPGKGALPGTVGQPPFIATEAQRSEVKKLVACGFTYESISVIMAIPQITLERHFKFELQHGKLMTDARVLGGIVSMAMEGDKTMAIFYAKARGGWRERGSEEATGAAAFTINISNATNGQIAPNDSDPHQITITAFPEPEKQP